jgi:hypothetical protein
LVRSGRGGNNTGDSIVEHIAGVDDFEVAEATYRAADACALCRRIGDAITAKGGD